MSPLKVGYARVSTDEQNLTAQRDGLAAREVKLSIAGSVYDPTDPMGKLLFNVLAMVAEFEADLIRARTREGMRVAKGRLRGKSPKLTPPARSSPRPATCCRRAHRGRAGRAVQCGPLHGLPRPSARRARPRERLAVGASWTLERGGGSSGSTSARTSAATSPTCPRDTA